MLKTLGAGRATIYPSLDALASKLVTGVSEPRTTPESLSPPTRVGSMFTWFFTDHKVFDWDTAAPCDTELSAASIAACSRPASGFLHRSSRPPSSAPPTPTQT